TRLPVADAPCHADARCRATPRPAPACGGLLLLVSPLAFVLPSGPLRPAAGSGRTRQGAVQMINAGSPLSTRRRSARRPALVAMARTAGIAGVVLALGGAAVPSAGAATVPSAGDGAAPAAASARSAPVAARSAAWAVQPTPNPLIRLGSLAAVSCTSPTACVA